MPNSKHHPFETIPLTGWYPGHMLKAGRQIQEQLRLVDLVVELLDARIPQTSRNPAFDRLLGNKPRCLILTKRGRAAITLLHDFRAGKLGRATLDSLPNQEKRI